MIKLIISAFLAIAVSISTVVIYYWRDSHYDPSQMDLVGMFILLPFVICILILSPYFIYKTIQYYRNEKFQQQKNQELTALKNDKKQQDKSETEQVVEHHRLNVLSSAAWHCFGENEEILQSMTQFKSPELDFQLTNNFGLPLLSYRIAELDQWLEKADLDEEKLFSNTRERRIQQLIQQQLQKHAHSMHAIAQQLKRSALFYDNEFAYQYRMHPGWNPENQYDYKVENDDLLKQEIVEEVARLNRLNIHILIAESLVHSWDDQAYQAQLLQQLEHDYTFLVDHVHIEFHFLAKQSAYAACMTLLQDIAQQSEEASLIIMADSEIDQEWVDENFWQNEQYIASEYAASWCLTAEQISLEEITAVQILKMSHHVKKLEKDLIGQQLDLSAQLETEQAFVLLLDEAKKSKSLQQLQQNFNPVGISSEYFIYIQSFIGNTQCFGHVLGLMLLTQMRDNVITMAYSLEQPHTYIYCENKNPEQAETLPLIA